MTRCPQWLRNLMQGACLLLTLMLDAGQFLLLCLHPSPALAAENLFLRKQLTLYQERHAKPRRATDATGSHPIYAWWHDQSSGAYIMNIRS